MLSRLQGWRGESRQEVIWKYVDDVTMIEAFSGRQLF